MWGAGGVTRAPPGLARAFYAWATGWAQPTDYSEFARITKFGSGGGRAAEGRRAVGVQGCARSRHHQGTMSEPKTPPSRETVEAVRRFLAGQRARAAYEAGAAVTAVPAPPPPRPLTLAHTPADRDYVA